MPATRVNIRETYRPGPDRLVYAAQGKDAERVVVRVYGPNHAPAQEIVLEKLEKNVFALYFNFKEVGNYIFVFEEDGKVQTILNAKVYA